MAKRHVETDLSREYVIIASETSSKIKARLKEKCVSNESVPINPSDPHSMKYSMSANYETGMTTFGFTFESGIFSEEIIYSFNGSNRVKKTGSFNDYSGIEVYFGDFTQEEVGETENIFFVPPLEVGLDELRMVDQIISDLKNDPESAIRLIVQLPTLEHPLLA